jgi:dihydrofolate reductase
MRKVIASIYATLDGVVEAPGEDGWSIPYFDEEAQSFAYGQLFASDALLLGRVTYEGFAQAWPKMTDEEGFADRMNSLPKFVMSRTLDRADWNNSTVIRGGLAEEVARLKQQPGQDILVYGSGQLVKGLIHEELLDELRLWVHPVVQGRGRRLFDDGLATTLKLADVKPLRSGVVILAYQPAETAVAAGVHDNGASSTRA